MNEETLPMASAGTCSRAPVRPRYVPPPYQDAAESATCRRPTKARWDDDSVCVPC
jgi:hypothetical protein